MGGEGVLFALTLGKARLGRSFFIHCEDDNSSASSFNGLCHRPEEPPCPPPLKNALAPLHKRSSTSTAGCVKQAGATAAQFIFSPQHSQFVNAAIATAKSATGVFMGRDVAQCAPKMGDLQNNRGQGAYTFQYAATHRSYPSHSAIVMEVGVDSKGNYLRTIGGNESDAVGMKEVRLDANGLVKNPGGLYISVIETLL